MSFRAWAECFKLDFLASLGMAGVANSIGWRVGHLESHLANVNKTYGCNTGTGYLDNSVDLPFVVTANVAAGVYGTPLKISSGAELTGGAHCNITTINTLSANQTAQTYKVRFWYGPVTPDYLACEFVFRASSALDIIKYVPIVCKDIPLTDCIWAECRCGVGGKTVSFILNFVICA